MGPRICKPLPPAQSLWELFSYDPLNGCLYNRLTRGSRSLIGTKAGSYDKCSGYTTIDISGERYLLHRVIYKWVTGLEPGECIDHVGQENIKPKYNAFHALANVDNRINISRSKVKNREHNLQTGVKVSGSKYAASIHLGTRKIYLGVYATSHEAASAYSDAAQILSSNKEWKPDENFYKSHNRLRGSSKYKGVCFHKQTKKWRAQILDKETGRVKHLGLFNTEEDAFECVKKSRGC